MTVPTVPDRPLTVPTGTVPVTVPTVPDPPLGGTVGLGTVGHLQQPLTVPSLLPSLAATTQQEQTPMTSHVEEQVQARIAAAKAKAQQQKRKREELAEARAAGLRARHATKAKRSGIRLGFCASCARPLMRNTYFLCSKGCGAKVCRGHPRCAQQHNPQCPKAPRTYTDNPQEAT